MRKTRRRHAKAKREYEKMNSTKKWRNATRGFILKNKPKPKKKTKAAAPNAQNKRNRAYIAKEVRGIMSRRQKGGSAAEEEEGRGGAEEACGAEG